MSQNNVQDFSLHTHTVGFDGRSTVAEMASRAKDLDMSLIGISNHFIVHPDVKKAHFYPHAVRGGYDNIYQSSFVDVLAKYREHYDEIDRVAWDMRMPILRGIEVDYFDNYNWHQGIEYAIKVLKPDYVIGACHLIEYNGRLCNVHDIKTASPADRDKMLSLYWHKVARAAKSGLFTFMAHLDLPKKVKVGNELKWRDIESRVVDTIAQTKTGIEINTSGVERMGASYPGPHILNCIAKTDIPVLISDDAHQASQIGRHFADTEELIRQYGIKNRLTLQKILAFSNKTL